MRKFYIVGLVVVAALIIGLAWAEQITVSTYYPAPAGVYNQMNTRTLGVGDNNGDSLINSNDAPDSTANPGDVWVAGNVGIGTTNPDPGAKLDVSSTTTGFLPPRMTTAQIDAISSPPEGLMVYNRTTRQWMGYNGTDWVDMGGGTKVAIGSYPGTGGDDSSITVGFQPDYVMILPHSGQPFYVKTDTMAGQLSVHSTGGTHTNAIQALQANGFEVGTDQAVNQPGQTFSYIAIKK